MTVIVAIKCNGGIVMAADRRVTANENGWRIPMAEAKIGRVGPMLVGACGSSQPGEVLLGLRAPKSVAPESAATYLRKRLLPKLRALLGNDDHEWAALIGMDGKLFEIDHRTVIEIDGKFWACGSGKEIAIGVTHAAVFSEPDALSREAATLIASDAIRITSAYNTTCGDGADVEFLPCP